MKQILLFAAVAAVSLASANERQYLWPKDRMPDRQPHQIAALTCDVSKPGFVAAENTEPYIEWYDRPEGSPSNDVCVILISGGGYYNQCDIGYVKEVWPAALQKEGVLCVNLVHRTPRPEGLAFYQSAWEDGQRAVRLVRSQAAQRGFDPEKIGVMSMSAGSHLATLLATSSQTMAYGGVDGLDRTPCHVNWATTFAIAYGMTDGLGTANTRDGDAIDVTLDPCFKFDAKTAPMCMNHGGNDPYSPATSTHVYRKLRQMKVPAELHLYPDKPHGMFGLDRSIEFMRQMGYLGPVAPEVELMSRFPNDDARASYEKKDIWPAGKMPDVQTNQTLPYLEWHMPKELKTRAIQIIWSGGGYWDSVPDGFEVAPARRYLNEKGMAVVTVNYRHPRPSPPLAKHTTAWEDAQRAIRMVRSEAAAKGLDPDRIGIMGSSAGGHLALMAATSSKRNAYRGVDDVDKIPCNVQWSVEIYPAYALTDGVDQGNTTGGNDDSARLVPEFSFDLATPPMLFIHGDADSWAAMNSVKAWEQLRRMGIQSELHTLALRKHCFQLKASPGTGSYTWLDRIWEFLTEKGFNK